MDIEMIEISENNIGFVIYPKEEKVLIKEKYYHIDQSEIDDFMRIIKAWKHEYINNSYFDGGSFSIAIYHDGKVDKIRGIRDYPDNYAEFSNFVRRIYERR